MQYFAPCVKYLNVGERKNTVIVAAFAKVPVVVNFLPKDDYITLLEAQIAGKRRRQ